MSGLDYFIFWIKLFVLALPFMLAGALTATLIPQLGLGVIVVINIISLIFGFFIMVMCSDEDELSMKSKRFLLLGKTVFFFACVFAIACLFKFGPGSQLITRIFWIPLTLIAAKVFFGTKFLETF